MRLLRTFVILSQMLLPSLAMADFDRDPRACPAFLNEFSEHIDQRDFTLKHSSEGKISEEQAGHFFFCNAKLNQILSKEYKIVEKMVEEQPQLNKCALITTVMEGPTFYASGMAPADHEGVSDFNKCIRACDKQFKERASAYESRLVTGRCRINGFQTIKTYGMGPFILAHPKYGYLHY
jgi:hypothetical protein